MQIGLGVAQPSEVKEALVLFHLLVDCVNVAYLSDLIS